MASRSIASRYSDVGRFAVVAQNGARIGFHPSAQLVTLKMVDSASRRIDCGPAFGRPEEGGRLDQIDQNPVRVCC